MLRQRLFALFATIAILLAACSAQTPAQVIQPPPTNVPTATSAPATATLVPATATATQAAETIPPSVTPSPVSPLVGTWQRVNSCSNIVQAFKQAGLIDLAPESLVGAGYYARLDQINTNDLCKGATEVKHSHFFTASGGFGSYDENGNQVDDGSYTIVDDHTITFPSGITVQYSVEGDTVRFNVIVRNPCTGTCRDDTAWAISAFYPGPFQRVP